MSTENRYRYENADGSHAYDVLRSPDKRFRQVPPNGKTGTGAMDGVEPVLYRLPELLAGINAGRHVWIVEGEKDADTLSRLGEIATTSPAGAGQWRERYAEVFTGAKVRICPDLDAPGANYAAAVWQSLSTVAESVDVFSVAHGKDITDHIDAGRTLDDLTPVTVAQLLSWPGLAPLNQVSDLPEWPDGCLPDTIERYTMAVAEETRTDPRLTASVVLGVLAGGCARLFRVAPALGRSWREPVQLWTVAVAGTGELKSAVYSIVTGPLYRVEREQVEATAHDRMMQASEQQAANLTYEKAVKTLGNAIGTKARDDARAELEVAVKGVNSGQATTDPQLATSDVTMQKLPGLLAANNQRLVVSSAEPSVLETVAGRYASGHQEDYSALLSGHSGDSLRPDRVGRETVAVADPAVTLVLTIQPERLRRLVNVAGANDLGLMGRFLFSICDSRRGDRSYGDAPPIPDELTRAWAELVRVLYGQPVPEQSPGLALSDQAVARFWQWRDKELEPRLGPSGDLGAEVFAGWSGKYAGTVLRLAGILHMAEQVGNGGNFDGLAPVPLATLERAIRLGAYFEVHALAAQRIGGQSERQRLAARLLRRGKQSQWQPVTARDLYQAVKSGNADTQTDDVTQALDELTEGGYCQPLPVVKKEGGGRNRSPLYVWNPNLRNGSPISPATSPIASGPKVVGEMGDGFGDSQTDADTPRDDLPRCVSCRVGEPRNGSDRCKICDPPTTIGDDPAWDDWTLNEAEAS